MNSSEEQQGTGVPPAGGPSAGGGSPHDAQSDHVASPAGEYDDGFPHEPPNQEPSQPVAVKPEPPPQPSKAVATVSRRPGGGGKKPPPPPPPGGDDDDDDGGMLRMSFLEHLE